MVTSWLLRFPLEGSVLDALFCNVAIALLIGGTGMRDVSGGRLLLRAIEGGR